MAGGEKWRKRRAAKQAAAAARPQPKPRNMSPFISTLAAELQLAVLSHLPVKQIQKCRALNRYMRDLVDSDENQVICAQPGLARAQNKFTQFIKTHVEYDIDAVDEVGLPCGFLNALVAYTKLRGISEEHACFEYAMEMSTFVHHWLLRCDIDGDDQMREDEVLNIVDQLVRPIHELLLHYEGIRCLSENLLTAHQEKLKEEKSLETMRLSANQLDAAIFQKIADGAFHGVPHHKEEPGILDYIYYESPHEYVLRGRKLGRKECRLRIGMPELTDGETFDEAVARERAARVAEELEEEATWSKVPQKNAVRGSHLAELESRRPDKRFSLVEKKTKVQDEDDFGFDYVRDYKPDLVGPKLQARLGVPKLPQSLPFGYYARTARTVKLLKGVLESDRKISLLERAAMLDRICIW